MANKKSQEVCPLLDDGSCSGRSCHSIFGPVGDVLRAHAIMTEAMLEISGIIKPKNNDVARLYTISQST